MFAGDEGRCGTSLRRGREARGRRATKGGGGGARTQPRQELGPRGMPSADAAMGQKKRQDYYFTKALRTEIGSAMLLNRSAAVGLKRESRGLNKQRAFGTCLYPRPMTKKNISVLNVVIICSCCQSARKMEGPDCEVFL